MKRGQDETGWSEVGRHGDMATLRLVGPSCQALASQFFKPPKPSILKNSGGTACADARLEGCTDFVEREVHR